MRDALVKFRKNTAGAALVEFSILLPVIFPLFFGMLEYGRLIYQHHIAEKGVKSAARYLARVVDDTGCGLSSTAFSTATIQAKTLAIYGEFDGSGTPSISNWTDNDISVDIDCTINTGGTWRGVDDLPLITVSTTFTYSDLGLLGALGQDAVTVTASHQELFVGG